MEEVIVIASLTFRATSCLWGFCCTRWLRCTPASSSDLLASRFSGPMPDQCLPHKSAAQSALLFFCPPIPEARYFFNTKTFYYRFSQQEEPALLLEILASCSTKTCFNCCFPVLPCSLQRSRSQWQRRC